MKKYLYSLMVALLATMSFTFTACGDDDDDEPNGKGGKVNVAFANSEIGSENYGIYESSVRILTEFGETHSTFLAYLGDISDYTMFQFNTTDELIKGKNLNVKSILFNDFVVSDGTYFAKDFTGTVTVTDVNNKSVTLSFKDFKFNRRTSSNRLQELTVNGSITYNKE